MHVESQIHAVRNGFMRDPKHFDVRFEVAREIVNTMLTLGVSYQGAHLLDIGSGDGVIDLAISTQAGARVSGIDIDETSIQDLLEFASLAGYKKQAMSAELEFFRSGVTEIPFASETFDHAYSWSVLEHVWDPVLLFKEARRVLKPNASLFIQIWPLWKSEYGAHLFNCFEPWSHLVRSRADVIGRHEKVIGNPELFHFATNSYDSCNRLSVSELQRGILAAGFKPVWVDFMTGPFHIPDNLHHQSWLDIGISGIKLVAIKA